MEVRVITTVNNGLIGRPLSKQGNQMLMLLSTKLYINLSDITRKVQGRGTPEQRAAFEEARTAAFKFGNTLREYARGRITGNMVKAQRRIVNEKKLKFYCLWYSQCN